MNEAANGRPEVPPETIDGIRERLARSRAFRALPAATQSALAGDVARVFDFIGSAPSRAMAPNLDSLRRSAQGGGPQPPGAPAPPSPATGGPPSGAMPPAGSGAIGRAASGTREVLGAIDFPSFVASLVQGTFRAIVDASIQQMEAYAQLLNSVAKSVDQFMAENVSDDMARDHLSENYGDVFRKDLSSGRPKLTVDPSAGFASGLGLPSFIKDLGFESPGDIDEQSLDEVVIPETRRTLAEMRHQTLATMVMMGINRIVVQDGEINAKLVFHVDATEAMTLAFNDTKVTNWNLTGQMGRNPFGASGILVNTTQLNAQSDVNLRADLTGEVKIRFRSETFPLERFADSAAIQLINTRARVPEQPKAEAAPAAAPPAPAVGLPPPPPPPVPAAQAARPSRAVAPAVDDPWMPRGRSS
jgi:hypothetical protein